MDDPVTTDQGPAAEAASGREDPGTPWQRWLLFAVLVSFALYNAVTYVQERNTPAKVPIGAAAPAGSIKLLSGDTVSLTPAAGEVLLIDFWATWCKPCVRSMPELLAVDRRLEDKPFRMVLINQDFGADDRRQLVRSFARSHAIEGLPVAIDKGPAAIAWGVSRLPTTVIIDARGVVRHRWTGAEDADTVVGLVEALLREG